jgi:hypothetical protein
MSDPIVFGGMVELAEGTGLENRRGFTPSVGSNPTPSAKILSGNALFSGVSGLFYEKTRVL